MNRKTVTNYRKWLSGQLRLVGGLLLLLGVAAAQADDATTHQVWQDRPIQLGTSGGNVNNISALYCCSGTLGALVTDGTTQYILSNNHVLADVNQGHVGDGISQPGLIDSSCVAQGAVATLTKYIPIQFKSGRSAPGNQVDAAIAQVVGTDVASDGSILGIGPVSGETLAPSVGLAVQKSGRTTGLTLGSISAVNVTVDVGYSSSCGGAANKSGHFVNQIRISGGSTPFSAGGDSGSLILEQASGGSSDHLPRAVGLLFAGSSMDTIANPIGSVLSALGVSMVSGTAPVGFGTVSGTVTDKSTGAGIVGATVSAGGQTTTTTSGGAYRLSNVPAGTQVVTASAAGYTSASQSVSVASGTTATADFALIISTMPNQSSVSCLTYNTGGGKGGTKNLLITIAVVDGSGNAVNNATVAIILTLNGASYGSASGTTSGGQVTFTTSNAPNGTYETTVIGVTTAGLTFDGKTPDNQFVKGTDPTPKSTCGPSTATQPDAINAGLDRAAAVKAQHSGELFDIPDVVGHGVSRNPAGEPVIEVYLANENADSRRRIPAMLENVPVRVIVTGPFVAY